MAHFNIKKLMQDEAVLFDFLRSSPQHAVVLKVIESAIDVYHRILPRVISAHDLGMQQDISLTIHFMKREAHDRVSIRFEHSMLEGVARLFGDGAVETLLKHQADAIAERHSLYADGVPVSPTLEHLFGKAGAVRVPTWGPEHGRANVSQQLALRAAREEVFTLSLEGHRAFHRGNPQESWQYRQRAEQARRKVAFYAEIDNTCGIFKMIREVMGAGAVEQVEEWVNRNTRISEFRALRDKIQRATYEGRIYTRLVSKGNRLRA
ncbi:hypothetical protein F2S72_08880 [Pseudomonas syringae pv. actinidiae]|nr:hypothetical protein [Pseudomonas syringae pv. actinidiae]